MKHWIQFVLSVMLLWPTSGQANTSSLKSFSVNPRSNHAVILVHGWGRSPRKPKVLWESKIKPYTDLTTLKRRFADLGFGAVHIVEYDDLQPLDVMASTVAEQIHEILSMSKRSDMTLDVVGHSMGQFVAAKAIVEARRMKGITYRLADHVRLFIGLAGIVRGQDELYPCTIFPDQCGGGGALEPYYVTMGGPGSSEVKRIFSENFEVFNRLKKCSVYSEADEIVKTPYHAASFRGLGFDPKNMMDVEINSRREKFHNDVKESETIFKKIVSHCYRLVRNS
jgi:hypothetical protein